MSERISTDAATSAKATTDRIAWSIAERAKRQGWKGKKADGLALESAIGALSAAIAFYGEEAPETNSVSLFAFMVSTRGLAYVQERAAQHTPAPRADS